MLPGVNTQFQKAGYGEKPCGEVLPAKGEGGIILVDCNGTLFDAAHKKGLNTELFKFLEEAEKRGYQVFLHSFSPDSNMSGYVPMLGLRHRDFKEFMARRNPEYPPILPKHDLIPTERAILTVDDEHDAGFMSKAAHKWAPDDLRIQRTLQHWEAVDAMAARKKNTPPL